MHHHTTSSYIMNPPNQIKKSKLCMDALTNMNFNIVDYEMLWQQCLLPNPEMASKIDKVAIERIRTSLHDYITILHRLGHANDPIAQEILKPGLLSGRIVVDLDTNSFSLSVIHSIDFNNDLDIIAKLNRLCFRAINANNISLSNDKSLMIGKHDSMNLAPSLSSNLPEIITTENVPETDDDIEEMQTELLSSFLSIDLSSTGNENANWFENQSLLKKKTDESISNSNISITEDCVLVLESIKDNMSSLTFDTLEQLPPAAILPNEESIVNNTNESLPSIEYDFLSNDHLNIDVSENSLLNQHQSHQEFSSAASTSPISIEYKSDHGCNIDRSDSMEMSSENSIHTPSSIEPTLSINNQESEDLSNVFEKRNNKAAKTIDIPALSKRLLLKPFIAFTQTDVTRLFNNAEAKNSVIIYLKEHQFIEQIHDLFLSMAPTRRQIKPEVGYLKVFSVTQDAAGVASFETKLREKIGITLNEYSNKIINCKQTSTATFVVNNIFNTTNHNWLLDRRWYEKFKQEDYKNYFRNELSCPENKISAVPPIVAISSNDNTHDSHDRPQSKLTASQKTAKELRRLGVKRSKKPAEEPPAKRHRKPKRFPDEE